jgi:hypothetical protein
MLEDACKIGKHETRRLPDEVVWLENQRTRRFGKTSRLIYVSLMMW